MRNVIKVEGILVNQLTYKPIAISSIRFSELKQIMKFTAREPNDFDPFKPSLRLEDLERQTNQEYFQRLTNDERVRKIYYYILDEINKRIVGKKGELGTFPTSVILAVDIFDQIDSLSEYENIANSIEDNDYIGAFFQENNRKLTLSLLPRKNVLIVDGQHRLAAMLKLHIDAVKCDIRIGRSVLSEKYPNLKYTDIAEILEDFELNCTLLLGFDLWEQGKVFADVNFNQKPVNKSLYYDIFGSLPNPDHNDIFLSHMLAKHMNASEKSPIKGFIKMLGSGSGYFSQAFFVEAISELLKPKGIWADVPIDYINGGKKHEKMALFFHAYFAAIRDLFYEYWPKQSYQTGERYGAVLAKTTGMGALIKLMNPVYKQLVRRSIDVNSIHEKQLKDEIFKLLNPLQKNASDYFSSNSAFSGAGSLGLQSKLYLRLCTDLGWFKSNVPPM